MRHCVMKNRKALGGVLARDTPRLSLSPAESMRSHCIAPWACFSEACREIFRGLRRALCPTTSGTT